MSEPNPIRDGATHGAHAESRRIGPRAFRLTVSLLLALLPVLAACDHDRHDVVRYEDRRDRYEGDRHDDRHDEGRHDEDRGGR